MNTFVVEAIANTRKVLPEYWDNTLKARLNGGVGSTYLTADWEETSHPDVMPGCRVFKTSLGGRYGIVEISSLPADTLLVADDRKNTGRVAMTVKGIKGELVPFTYLIIGKEDGIDVVYTFHPGEPIRPSVVETATLSHGSKVSKAYAKELGFDLAKIV